MNKVYQRIIDHGKGDCWKCSICTLLGLEYEAVPNFVEYGDMFYEMAVELFKQQQRLVVFATLEIFQSHPKCLAVTWTLCHEGERYDYCRYYG